MDLSKIQAGEGHSQMSHIRRKGTMKRILFKGVVILGLCLCLDGCIAAAVGTYAVVKRHRTRKQYREYVADIEDINQKRRELGLEPMHIKSFKEWKRGPL